MHFENIRVFWRIAIWQVILCLLPSAPSLFLGVNSNFFTLKKIFLFQSGFDSWRPIGNAMAYVASHKDLSQLYQVTYFHNDAQFIYSPQSLALFILLKRFTGIDLGSTATPNVLSWLLLIVMSGLALYTFRLLARLLPLAEEDRRIHPAMVVAAVFSVYLSFPVTMGYMIGNIQNFLTTFIVIAMLLYMRERSFAAGMVLALAVLVKPNIGVLAVWALVRGDWRFVAGMAVTCLSATAVSLAMFGWPVHAAYLDLMHFLSSRGESFYTSHTWEGTIYRFIHDGNNMTWDPTHTTLVPLVWVHVLALVLGIATMTYAFWLRKGEGPLWRMMDFGAAVLAIVISSPVAYEHHMGLSYLIVPVLLLVVFTNKVTDKRILALMAFVYICLGSMPHFVDVTARSHLNFLQSYRLYGTLILMALIYHLRPMLTRPAPAVAVP